MVSFTSHNIRLDDGTYTKPDAGFSMDVHPWFLAAKRLLDATFPGSKEHLRIAWENGSYVVTDLGSSFGTRLNGQAVSRAALSPLDRIAVGDTVMIFETDEP